jgi:hypothetical protein
MVALRIGLFSFLVLWNFAAISVLKAQNADISSERVSMDQVLLRAVDGTTSPGKTAVWPQSIYSFSADSLDTISLFTKYLTEYYGPAYMNSAPTQGVEFALVSNGRFRGLALNDGVARFQADFSMMVRPGITNNDTTSDVFFLARPSFRMLGSLEKHLGYFLELSNGMRLAGESRRIAEADPTLARITRFVSEDTTFFDQYVGYIQYQSDWLRIRFGREALQFGFSPIDNFVHSIDALLLDGLLIDIPYKSFRFTTTQSSANGTDTAGSAVPSKYIATHRIAFDPASWLSVGVNDMIVYWGRGLDFAYLNPLAFYTSAGLGTAERNANDNSLLVIDAAIRPVNGTMAYGSLVVDDLSFSTLGDTSAAGNNNKFAFQIGVTQSFGNGEAGLRSLASIEYVKMDPFAFSHRSINASYTNYDAPVGYDIQPNSDRIALQWRTWFEPQTFIRIDVDFTRHGENLLDSNGNIVMGEDPRFPGSGSMVAIGNVGGDILRGDADDLQGNRFLRGIVSYQQRVRLWFSAEWFPNVFTDVKLGYTNRNGGNSPATFWYGSIEARIGY